MRVFWKASLRALVAATLLCAAVAPSHIRAQERQHVVTLDDLKKDTVQPSATRLANEAEIRKALSSDPAQKALKSANVDYKQVDRSIGQLSDEDAAKLAERARIVNQDFAAGNFSDRDILIIILVAVLIVVLIVALR